MRKKYKIGKTNNKTDISKESIEKLFHNLIPLTVWSETIWLFKVFLLAFH